MSVEAPMKLTPDESVLLKAMRNGIRPLVRATTGRAVIFRVRWRLARLHDCSGWIVKAKVSRDRHNRQASWMGHV